jgi:ParB family chromosome partitioning protein
MKLPHIVQALSQAGLAGAAQDAAKMKKKDAAEHAEHFLSKIRWVPEWMTSADNQKQLAAKSELSLATSQNDTDADAGDVTDHNNRPAPPDNGDAALRGGDKETENENVTDSGCPENHVF